MEDGDDESGRQTATASRALSKRGKGLLLVASCCVNRPRVVAFIRR